MTQDDIIRMAREHGLRIDDADTLSTSRESYLWVDASYFDIDRFAAAVTQHEREACAKLCEARAEERGMAYEVIALDCAAAIRARV